MMPAEPRTPRNCPNLPAIFFLCPRSTLLDFRNNQRFGNFVGGLLDVGGFLWPRDGRGDDSAHPPIHPAKSVDPSSLQGEERKVWDWKKRMNGWTVSFAVGFEH